MKTLISLLILVVGLTVFSAELRVGGISRGKTLTAKGEITGIRIKGGKIDKTMNINTTELTVKREKKTYILRYKGSGENWKQKTIRTKGRSVKVTLYGDGIKWTLAKECRF